MIKYSYLGYQIHVFCPTKEIKDWMCKGNVIGDKENWSENAKIPTVAKLFLGGVGNE